MRVRWLKALAPILLVPLLCGCWDLRDIEERDIVTLVIVDQTEEGVVFLVEFAKPASGAKGSGSSSEYVFRRAAGDSLVTARAALERQLDHPLYLGAANAVIITEAFAKNGIDEYMYRLRETNDYRKMVDILVTGKSSDDFLQIATEKMSIGVAIGSTVSSLQEYGQMFDYRLPEILETLAGSCKCFLLPNVQPAETDIEVEGFSVFRDGKFIGSISPESTNGILLMRVQSPRFSYRIPLDDSIATVQLERVKRDIQPEYSDGQIRFTVKFRIRAKLAYLSNNAQPTEEFEQRLSEALEQQIEQDVAEVVQTARDQFKADYLEFHMAFRIRYPVEFRQMNWDEVFPSAEIRVQASVDLDTRGALDYMPHDD